MGGLGVRVNPSAPPPHPTGSFELLSRAQTKAPATAADAVRTHSTLPPRCGVRHHGLAMNSSPFRGARTHRKPPPAGTTSPSAKTVSPPRRCAAPKNRPRPLTPRHAVRRCSGRPSGTVVPRAGRCRAVQPPSKSCRVHRGSSREGNDIAGALGEPGRWSRPFPETSQCPLSPSAPRRPPRVTAQDAPTPRPQLTRCGHTPPIHHAPRTQAPPWKKRAEARGERIQTRRRLTRGRAPVPRVSHQGRGERGVEGAFTREKPRNPRLWRQEDSTAPPRGEPPRRRTGPPWSAEILGHAPSVKGLGAEGAVRLAYGQATRRREQCTPRLCSDACPLSSAVAGPTRNEPTIGAAILPPTAPGREGARVACTKGCTLRATPPTGGRPEGRAGRL